MEGRESASRTSRSLILKRSAIHIESWEKVHVLVRMLQALRSDEISSCVK